MPQHYSVLFARFFTEMIFQIDRFLLRRVNVMCVWKGYVEFIRIGFNQFLDAHELCWGFCFKKFPELYRREIIFWLQFFIH